MRKINALLSGAIMLFFVIHAIIGTFQMTGIYPGGGMFSNAVSYGLIIFTLLHALIGVILTAKTVISVKKSGEVWTATVKASFQLVGTVSGEVNSYAEYFTAVDTSGIYAIEKARQIATQKSAEEIADLPPSVSVKGSLSGYKIYEAGETQYLDVILSSADLSDFLSI